MKSPSLLLFLTALLFSDVLLAIPSPDLVINLSASVAQLLGLLSVVFGGFAVSANKRGGKVRAKRRKGGRLLFGVAGVLLLGSITANVLQYTSSVDNKNLRLHTNLVRKSVENGQTVGDTSLKTLSFSEQLSHDQGISTETLDEWLNDGEPINIIDVRENEEFEVGSIEGALHVRYPDVLSQSSLIPDNGRTLLLCYSGNRSSELCGELTKQGKSCNFMVGGYEKWLTESRELSSDMDLSTDDLRQLPDFPNKNLLLDTPDVHALVANESAEFVDVRYPQDFVKSHLPDAHNITMRALGSAALEERINALPKKPIIAACYDKRSCFYGQLIGLRLSRAGLDFRGRYTVPHEYYIPRNTERDHVKAWKQDQEQFTLASYVVSPMRNILNSLVSNTGHYAIALLIVVLLIRLLLLPLSMKAERDTRVQKSLAGKIDVIKAELSDHPRAMSESIMALYKRFNIRPVINIVSSIFQLVLMLLFYSAVNKSSSGWSHSFLWLDSASMPDPLLILPVLVSVLFLGVLVQQSSSSSVRKRMLLGLGTVFLFALLHKLGAAVNLYLGISMVFLILQGMAFKKLGNVLGWDTLGADRVGTITDTGLIKLADAHLLPDSTGKKAARLGELMQAGYNVPDGFVFTSRITNRSRGKRYLELLDAEQSKVLNKLWKGLNTDKVAVRSSGANEDGADSSFAGVYESILNVSRDGLISAVREVYDSLASDRSSAYTQYSSEDGSMSLDQGGVVIQKMIDAEYAGVMFTEHPGTTGAMMVELVSGLGEELVSGNVTPETFAFGKLTSTLIVDGDLAEKGSQPAIDLRPLLVIGRELERLFDHPQDVEWAYAKGKFYILQARDITRSVANGKSLHNLAEFERRKLLDCLAGEFRQQKDLNKLDSEQAIFIQNELSELLPRPLPFSAEFMERLWAAGGSTDLACHDLGIPYKVNFRSMPYINTIFGWTYVNKFEERRRLGKGPGAMASFNLARGAEATEREFREEFLPQFQAEMAERNALSFDRLSLDEATNLLDRWVARFVEETYFAAERINIAADFHMKSALEKLKAAKLDPALYLNDHEETVVSYAMSQLRGTDTTADNVHEFLSVFGHRAPLDYELSEPRFDENMDLVRQYIERSQSNAGEESAAHANADVALPAKKVLAISIQRARNFTRLKEDAKHHCLVELAQIRSLLLQIDRLASLNGRVFYLHLNEIMQLGDQAQQAHLQNLADERFVAARLWNAQQLPAVLSLNDLERIDMLTGARADKTELSELAGKRVAGEQEVIGRARVINDISEIDTFESGEILIARMTDPTWYPLFSQARGIVTEVGGWLSHAAIVAREYDLPAIVGVAGVCQRIDTGDVIRLGLSGDVEILEERRAKNSPLRNNVRTSATEYAGANSSDASVKSESVEGSAAASADGDVNVYNLTSRKMFRYQQGIDRRMLKNELADRRSEPRHTESGELQVDRRIANRVAAIEQMKKVG